MPHVVVIPAGPGDEEPARVADLVAAIHALEPQAPSAIVVVDDAPPRAWPEGVTAIANPRRGRGIGTLGGTCAATLAGLAWAHDHHPSAWVLRLDTDALVIAPYAARVAAALRPDTGILGSCHVTCNGQRRDISRIGREVRRHARPVWMFARPPRRRWAGMVRLADPRTRAIIHEARAQGYVPGEHCIAAGCAISPAFIAAAAERGWLADPRRWIEQRLGDDMLLGAMVRATGLRLTDATGIFGIAHVGLPDTPERLAARGFSVVHSLKGPTEPELRAGFAEARA